MNQSQLTLLNTSILTSYGTFIYQPLSLEQARQIVREYLQNGKIIQSAIGHQSTAEVLASLLAFPVAVNRMEFKQSLQDVGLVFKLKGRPPEGKVLDRDEIEALGYEFGLLKRVA